MFTNTIDSETPLQELVRAAESVRASTTTSIEALTTLLRITDHLTATAVGMLQRGGIEQATGLSPEAALTLEARRTGPEARTLTAIAATLRAMPLTNAAFMAGKLTWAQVREIGYAVKSVDVQERAQMDAFVQDHASRSTDPQVLIDAVSDKVDGARARRALVREDRAFERGYIMIQPAFDGSSQFFGRADAPSTATMLEAMDAKAARPVNADNADAVARSQQRFDAMVAIFEGSLTGTDNGLRPRPRLIATIDLTQLTEQGRTHGAQLLWNLPGRPPKLTPLTTDSLICDATITPVIFDGARPVAVGDSYATVSNKLRTALIARDGGCRFPTCGAPVAWTDSHHIQARINQGDTRIENLVLLCRRCHRRAHRYRWRIEIQDNGDITFERQGKTYISHSRTRPPPRE